MGPHLPFHDLRHLPLRAISDNELTCGRMVVDGVGHSPVVKVAGSCLPWSRETLVLPSNIKGKAKRKQADSSGDSSDTDSEDSDSPPRKQSTHGGRRTGAGNYQEQDIKSLSKYTQKLLPIGQRGWKKVHEKYANWANMNGRPVREWKNLENKFKNVRHLWIIFSFFKILFDSLIKLKNQREMASAQRASHMQRPSTK